MTAIYIVRRIGNGFIGLMPRPGVARPLQDDIHQLQKSGTNLVVSLLEAHETGELGLDAAPVLFAQSGIEHWSYPVPDRGLPPDVESFNSLVHDLVDRLNRGDGVIGHCWGGIGRSGLLVAAVLTSMGSSPTESLMEVAKARGEAVPETEEQGAWLHRYGELMMRNRKPVTQKP